MGDSIYTCAYYCVVPKCLTDVTCVDGRPAESSARKASIYLLYVPRDLSAAGKAVPLNAWVFFS